MPHEITIHLKNGMVAVVLDKNDNGRFDNNDEIIRKKGADQVTEKTAATIFSKKFDTPLDKNDPVFQAGKLNVTNSGLFRIGGSKQIVYYDKNGLHRLPIDSEFYKNNPEEAKKLEEIKFYKPGEKGSEDQISAMW